MNTKYKLSIIIPVYNAEKYIDRCLESILCQIQKNDVEIIMIDDGSYDNSLEVCEKYQRDNIIVIHQENQGVSVARNKGITKANGEWIVFIDIDDYIYPNFFKIIDEHISKEYDFVLFNYSVDKFEENDDYSEIELKQAEINQLIKKFLGEKNLLTEVKTHLNTPWAKVYRHEFLIEYDIKFIKGIKIGEDVIFNMNVFKHAQKGKYINQKVYVYSYNNNPNSVVHKYDEYLLENDKRYYKYLKGMIDSYDNETISLFNSCIARGLVSYYHTKIFNKQNRKSYLEKLREVVDVISEWPYNQVMDNYESILLKLKLKDKILIFLTRQHCFKLISIYCMLRYQIKEISRYIQNKKNN